MQVWKDALAQKQESPYMRHTLAIGTIRDFHFCPYEVSAPSSSMFGLHIHVQIPDNISANSTLQFSSSDGMQTHQEHTLIIIRLPTRFSALASKFSPVYVTPAMSNPEKLSLDEHCSHFFHSFTTILSAVPHVLIFSSVGVAMAQDVLAVGHSGGMSTMLVPGAGEPHYDSRVADPYQGRKARREQEVAHLLDKLQPDMIVLDPTTIAQACFLHY